MKIYTFYAKTNPAFRSALSNELNLFKLGKISNLKADRLNFVKFQSNFKDVWQIMTQSRLIESLKLQIADNIKAK
jgi:hypothetical protein